MSGRFSPINSPTRNKRGQLSEDSRSSQPPSFVSSHSGGNSRAYANLMEYLDNQTSRGSNNDGHDDDMSSVSHSFARSPIESSANGKYIWNQIDVETESKSIDTTYFRPPPSYVSDKHSVASASTVQTSVEEIKTKVQGMKEELQSKQQRAKQLQTELTRITAAKSRKLERSQQQWNRKFQELQNEHSEMMNKQRTFIDKLQDDVKKLTNKITLLTERLEKTYTDRTTREQTLLKDINKQRRQNMQQMETDEKVYFQKLLQQKSEQFKKQANEAATPKLERIVNENRDNIIKRKEQNDMKILAATQKYREIYQSEFDSKMRSLMEKYELEENQIWETNQKRIIESQRRHEMEINSLKERHEQSRKQLEDMMNKKKRLNHERELNASQLQKDEEYGKIRELNQKIQRELQSTLVTHNNELDHLKQEQHEQFQKWKQEYHTKLQNKQEYQIELQKNQMQQQAMKELEEIREKLKMEFASKREQIRNTSQLELENKQFALDAQIQTLFETETRAKELNYELQEEIHSLQHRVLEYKQRVNQLKIMIQEIKGKIEREERQSEYQDNESITTQSTMSMSTHRHSIATTETELKSLSTSYETQVHELKHKVDAIQKDNVKTKQSLDSEYQQQRMAHKDECNRIESKISVLLSQKEANLNEMKNNLKMLRQKNLELENSLDTHRNNKIMR